jgi:hypothetical protein
MNAETREAIDFEVVSDEAYKKQAADKFQQLV